MILASLLAAGQLRPLDVQAGRLAARLDPDRGSHLALCTALVSRASGQGHTCLPLSLLAEQVAAAEGREHDPVMAESLHRLLSESPLVGRPGDLRPLILDADRRLYLLRFHTCESLVARDLLQRADGQDRTADPEAADALLDRLFAPAGSEPDWQRLAAAMALRRQLVIISGGPGTGKTYTVARILALTAALRESGGQGGRRFRIGLAAPTGKAALRLGQSIRAARPGLPPDLASALPDHAQTLHRLLGVRIHGTGFTRNRANPLQLDLLIIDEASMIDISLMAALLDALPPACRLILLGDRDQLASVEAGNLLADLTLGLTDTPSLPSVPCAPANPLADSLVLLRASRRFHPKSGIGALARAVNNGDANQLAEVLERKWPDVHLAAVEGDTGLRLGELLRQWFEPLGRAASAEDALGVLASSRVLCALRDGPRGVSGINQLVETDWRRRAWIRPGEPLYRGMPILIERNDYRLGLFNGDTGILWPEADGRLTARFAGEDGGTLRSIPIHRLPAWQPSFALTVHKSQGSEYDQVLLVLPDEDVAMVTRELLYTGITRASGRLSLFVRMDLLRLAITRRVTRHCGLFDQLRRLQEQAKGAGCHPSPQTPCR